MSLVKYSKDKRVVFHEDTHSYFLGDKKLTSITQYISRYKPKFDREGVSLSYAKKHGRTQKDVLEEWDAKAKESCEMGTYVHKIFEDYIEGKTLETEAYPKGVIAKLIIEEFFESKRLTPVETELIVYNDEFAGQIDCIAKDEHGNHFILDWKTNKEIKTFNSFQSMEGKFWVYDDCNFNHYSIQLRAYQQMCKDYNIVDCYIVHLDEDSYSFMQARDIKPF